VEVEEEGSAVWPVSGDKLSGRLTVCLMRWRRRPGEAGEGLGNAAVLSVNCSASRLAWMVQAEEAC